MPGHCMANPRIFAAVGAITQAGSPQELTAFLKLDAERWARVIKAAGVKEE